MRYPPSQLSLSGPIGATPGEVDGDAGTGPPTTPGPAPVSVPEIATGSRPRVLLADDNETVRDTLGRLLLRSGYEVTTAADGQAAVEVLKDDRVDAVLLDLQMPGHDGFEALEYLQEHRRSLPVLLLSGLPADEIQTRMHRLSSGELPPLFLKPCDYDQLLDVLDLMLSGALPPHMRQDVE